MDNVDDMFMEGRVTRSLRKRLTSVDNSDTGSRPCSPQLTKLSTISESKSSPSQSLRATRRNSITSNGTPMKAISKSKSSVINELQEVVNSPAKRITRRSSVSATRTPNKAYQEDIFERKTEKLSDEEKDTKTKDLPSIRLTRMHSRSPPQVNVKKTLRSDPPKEKKTETKFTRKKLLSESDSEVEVQNIEENHKTENGDPKREAIAVSPKKRFSPKNHSVNTSIIETIDLSNDTLLLGDKNIECLENSLEENVVSDKTLKDGVPLSTLKNEKETTRSKSVPLDSVSKETHEQEESKFEKSVRDSTYENQKINKEDIPEKNESTINLELSEDDEDIECAAFEKTRENSFSLSTNKVDPLVESVIMLQKLSPNIIAKICNENNVMSPKTSKCVTFPNNIDDVDIAKSVYPKTPASIKSRSFIEKNSSKSIGDDSLSSNNSSVHSFKDAGENVGDFQDQINSENKDSTNNPAEKNSREGIEKSNECSPQKQKALSFLQSSSPMWHPVLMSKSESKVNVAMNSESEKINSPDKFHLKSPKKFEDENSAKESIYKSNDNILDNSSNQEQNADFQMKEDGTGVSNSEVLQLQLPLASTNLSDIKLISTSKEQVISIVEEKDNKDGVHSKPLVSKNVVGTMPTLTQEESLKVSNKRKYNADYESSNTFVSTNDTLSSTDCLGLNGDNEKNKNTYEVGCKSLVLIPVTGNNDCEVHGNSKSNDEKNYNHKDIYAKSWIHNVSGFVKSDNKIDKISVNTSMNKSDQEVDLSVPKALDKDKASINESGEADEDSFQKLEFIDDEAMDASDDYQSGDSLDEEERKEIEQNEIVDDGESIGTEDTLSDGSNEGEDDVNASFVTSDSEEALLEYSDDKDFDNASKKWNKMNQNHHIIVTSESEDGEESFNENKTKPTKKSTKGINRRKCFIASSESESDDQSTTKLEEENTNIVKSPLETDLPLIFDVSKMIDAVTDNEMNINETLHDEQNDTSKTCQVSENSLKSSEYNEDMTGNLFNCGDAEDTNMNEKDRLGTNIITKISNLKEFTKSTEYFSDSQWGKSSPTSSKETASPDREAAVIDVEVDNGISYASTTNVKQNEKSGEDEIQKPLNSSNDSITSINSAKRKFTYASKVVSPKDLTESKNERPESDSDDEDDIEIPETQEVERAEEVLQTKNTQKFEEFERNRIQLENELSESESKDEEDNEIPETQDVERAPCLKKIGFSVSFCETKETQIDLKPKDSPHQNSFTIDVGATNEEIQRQIEIFKPSSVDPRNRNDIKYDMQEQQKVELLKGYNSQHSVTKIKRQSLFCYGSQNTEEFSSKKGPKRKSLQLASNEKFNPSKSLNEIIESRKNELTAGKSHLSKSFVETTKLVSNGPANSSSCNSSNEEESKNVNKSSTPRNLNIKTNQKDYTHILDRCNKILEEANRAKLESKQNCKKRSMLHPIAKKSSKQSVFPEEESSNHSVIKGGRHLKEKTTALEQAFRASAKILLNEVGKKEKPSHQINGGLIDDKRLPMQILESLSDNDSNAKVGKKKCNLKTLQPIVQRMHSATGEIIEEILVPRKKKRPILKKFELPTGTVMEEPVTPKKTKNQNGFRESPITPNNLGFKVRQILFAGQDKVPESHNSRLTGQKRKRKIVDQEHILPKPQWSQSGVFFEEEVLPKFNDKKRFKFHDADVCWSIDSSSALNALNFKNSTIFRKNVLRESSEEVLKRRERQYVSRKYI